MTNPSQAATNALTLLRAFTVPQDDALHFDHVGFLNEMEYRAQLLGRKLTQRDQRALARMVKIYCKQYNVVSGTPL